MTGRAFPLAIEEQSKAVRRAVADQVTGPAGNIAVAAQDGIEEKRAPQPELGGLFKGLGRKTVKFFINEAPGTGCVANVKLIWNDWHMDGATAHQGTPGFFGISG